MHTFGRITQRALYRDRLSPEQIASGINAARKNGKRLLADAQLLLENGRCPSAASFAVLAMEEFSKEEILRRFAMPQEQSAKVNWKDFKNHYKKGKALGLHAALTKDGGPKTLADIVSFLNEAAEDYGDFQNWLKQLGFYSDCVVPGEWLSPDLEIDKEHASRLVEMAELAQGSLERADVTAEEIEDQARLLSKDYVTREEYDEFVKKWGIKDMLPFS